jgi:hypothetical protein
MRAPWTTQSGRGCISGERRCPETAAEPCFATGSAEAPGGQKSGPVNRMRHLPELSELVGEKCINCQPLAQPGTKTGCLRGVGGNIVSMIMTSCATSGRFVGKARELLTVA